MFTSFLKLGNNLAFRLPAHQGLRLGEKIGQEDPVVEAVRDRVDRFDRCEEVCWDQLGALVDELIKGCNIATKRVFFFFFFTGGKNRRNAPCCPFVPGSPQMMGPVE